MEDGLRVIDLLGAPSFNGPFYFASKLARRFISRRSAGVACEQGSRSHFATAEVIFRRSSERSSTRRNFSRRRLTKPR